MYGADDGGFENMTEEDMASTIKKIKQRNAKEKKEHNKQALANYDKVQQQNAELIQSLDNERRNHGKTISNYHAANEKINALTKQLEEQGLINQKQGEFLSQAQKNAKYYETKAGEAAKSLRRWKIGTGIGAGLTAAGIGAYALKNRNKDK